METNLETRLERLAIEQWPEYPEGAHLPVTAARLGYPAARDTGPMDNGATDLYDGFGQLVARLMEEIEAVREEITAIRAERAPLHRKARHCVNGCSRGRSTR